MADQTSAIEEGSGGGAAPAAPLTMPPTPVPAGPVTVKQAAAAPGGQPRSQRREAQRVVGLKDQKYVRVRGDRIFRKEPILNIWEQNVIRLLQFWSCLAGAAYVIFRWVCFARAGDWPLFPFILAETAYYFVQPMAVYMCWKPLRRPAIPLDALVAPEAFPKVDIFIPCYTEPVDIIVQTTLAASRMDYPHDKFTVYVLDDSARPELRDAIEKLASTAKPRVRYIARKKYQGVPHHAKAGNLNNALLRSNSDGDYIVIFDCDMVALPCFLKMSVSHFYMWDRAQQAYVRNPKMGIVQTPQDFYNVPANDPLGQRYLYFYDYLLCCWEGHGCVPCCGTNVVFSRQALVSIGGFRMESITEDVLTSMTLHDSGYESCYVNQRMAFGLTPTDIGSYHKQRQRWAVGSLEIFLKDPPYLRKGMTFTQKMLYTWMLGQYLLSLPNGLLLLLPVLYLIAPDKVLFHAHFITYAAFFLPNYIPQQMVSLLSSDDVGLLYWLRGQQEQVYTMFISVEAVLMVFLGVRVSFTVTPKDGATKMRKEHNLPFVLPHLAYCIFAAYSLYHFLHAVANGTMRLTPMDTCAFFFDMIYVSMVCFSMAPPIRYFLHPPKEAEELTVTDFLFDRMQTALGYGLRMLDIRAVAEHHQHHPHAPLPGEGGAEERKPLLSPPESLEAGLGGGGALVPVQRAPASSEADSGDGLGGAEVTQGSG